MSFKKASKYDAKRPNQPHKLIIYGYAFHERKVISSTLNEIKESDFIFVDDCILNTRVYDIVNNTNTVLSSTNNAPTNVKFMLMSGFSNTEMHMLFKSLKKHGIDMPLATSLNSTNQNYVFKDLICDVCLEHDKILKNNIRLNNSIS